MLLFISLCKFIALFLNLYMMKIKLRYPNDKAENKDIVACTIFVEEGYITTTTLFSLNNSSIFYVCVFSTQIRSFIMELPGRDQTARSSPPADVEEEEFHDKKDIRYLKELIKNLG